MIFVDSNIPMYLVGAEHPLKSRARDLVERLIEARERLVTDVEVFQEILHRYVAIERRDAIEPAWEVLTALADEVFPIGLPEVEGAKRRLLELEQLSARDALHLAVIEAQGIERILSFDSGFDGLAGLRRLH